MPPETTLGYSPPVVTQYSVFLSNKVGKLHDLMDRFERATCRVCAVSVHEASDHAVVRLITNDSREARALLRREALPYSEVDVLVVELTGGHSLESLCLCLLGAEINIRFAYPLMLRPNGTPTIALSVDETDLAGQLLRRRGFRLFGEADILDVA
ncbi:MAG: acetolactate synthase [Planctomycetota bacterium]